jgi:TolB protein
MTQRSNASAKLYIGTKLSLTLLLAITAVGYAPLVQAADITIEKAAPRSNLQVAIVPFAGAESISGIISNDLTNLGQFSLDNNLPERPHSSGEVTLPVWQHKAVPYLVVGNTRTNRGDVEINFEVINVGTGEVMQGAQQVKTKNNPQALRLAGHKVADKIYEILTGIKGDFSGKIAYVIESGTPKNRVSRLVISDVDGYNPQIIQTVNNGTIKALTPSANGRTFTYTVQQAGYPVVYSADVMGGGVTNLTPFKANNLGASVGPDGSVIFSSDFEGGKPQIYLASGGTPRRLTNDPVGAIFPSWAPDGRSFVFTSDRNGNNRGQVFRYNMGSGSVQQLTRGGLNSMGRISNDGKKMSYLAGTNQGMVMDLASGSATGVNNVGLSEAPGISPNGQHYIYSSRNVITIVSNGKTVSISPSQNGVPNGTIYGPIWLNPEANNSQTNPVR